MKFLGIDFGWMTGPSGLCCLSWQDGKLHIIDLTRLDTIEDILAWVDAMAPTPTPALVAVDAPTLIPNATGMRLPDKLAHKYFGKYHAGCYPANLNSRFASRTVGLGLALEMRGFFHAPKITPQAFARYQIEVFPHPAIVALFGLERILKYKNGRLFERSLELAKLREYVIEVLPSLTPNLNVLKPPICPENYLDIFTDFSRLGGSNLKAIEDKLDALICAYVGAFWWHWGSQRNVVLGDESTGYIVVPKAK